MTTDPWGIAAGYLDTRGVWHDTPPETRAAILAAMGADAAAGGPPAIARVRVVRPGETPPVEGPAQLVLEDGSVLRMDGVLPPRIPFGYHELRPADGRPAIRLISVPERCYLPADLRTWGWAVQLYAARSRESWGIGDLADLRRLARWSAGEQGAGVLLVNPLTAATPAVPIEPSPYMPSSRRYRNPLYLRVEEVPGAAEAGVDLAPLAAAGRALNGIRRIDRDAVLRLKMDALGRLWRRFAGDAAFDRYRAEHGEALAEFATFCGLAEQHGRDWRRWPAEHRRPGTPAVARFRAERADHLRFHEWLQWLLDGQLGRVAGELAVVQDLPIGVDSGGADAWAWQDVLATDATVGAPPDVFNALGQDWGLPPFVPYRLAELGYEPFVQTIRATLRYAGGLRIDHVMGLFRLWWIPKGMSPADGAYVRYPADDLLGIVALESHRARAVVVGEDLGTVEPGTRERLGQAGVLSYRVLWFERERPAAFPSQALAAVTTHDLPTVAGLWTGADLRDQRAAGLHPSEEAMGEIRERLAAMTGVADDAPAEVVIERAYRLLGEAPSRVLTATLEDACAVPERPNMPGTFTEWPNWSLALPVPLEELEGQRLPRAIADALGRRRSPSPPSGARAG
jgi:4-alpha-glucanotransferase